jgi:hypothetical protein
MAQIQPRAFARCSGLISQISSCCDPTSPTQTQHLDPIAPLIRTYFRQSRRQVIAATTQLLDHRAEGFGLSAEPVGQRLADRADRTRRPNIDGYKKAARWAKAQQRGYVLG